MSPLPCPDLQPALPCPPASRNNSLEIHKQGVGERSDPHSLYIVKFLLQDIVSATWYLTPVLSTVPQTTTNTSFLISGVRGKILSTLHVPSDDPVSPLARGSGIAAPEVSPPQPKSPMGDQKYQVHSLLTAQVRVHIATCVHERACLQVDV